MSQSTHSPASRTIEQIVSDLSVLRTEIIDYAMIARETALVSSPEYSVGYVCGGTIYDGRLVLSCPQSRAMSRAGYALSNTPETLALIAELQSAVAGVVAPATKTMAEKLAHLYVAAADRPNGFAALVAASAAVGISRQGNGSQAVVEYYTDAGMSDDPLSLGGGEILQAREDYLIHSVRIEVGANPDFDSLVKSGKLAVALRQANLV